MSPQVYLPNKNGFSRKWPESTILGVVPEVRYVIVFIDMVEVACRAAGEMIQWSKSFKTTKITKQHAILCILK